MIKGRNDTQRSCRSLFFFCWFDTRWTSSYKLHLSLIKLHQRAPHQQRENTYESNRGCRSSHPHVALHSHLTCARLLSHLMTHQGLNEAVEVFKCDSITLNLPQLLFKPLYSWRHAKRVQREVHGAECFFIKSGFGVFRLC